MSTYKYEVHGTKDGKPFYATFKAVDNPNLDPEEPPLIIKAANQEKLAWSFEDVYERAQKIFESIGVTDVKVTDSRF